MIDLNVAHGRDNLPELFCAFQEYAAAAARMPDPASDLTEAEWAALNDDPLDDPERWAAFCKRYCIGARIGRGAQVRNVEAEELRPEHRSEEAQPASSGDLAVLAADFLKLLRAAGPWQLSAIDPDSGKIVTRTIKTPEAARGFIREHDGKRNLYFSVNPVRVENIKASKTDIAAIEFVLGDLDPRDDEAPNAAKGRYLAALKPFLPAPTFVIDSGNGVQALWRLDQPIALPKPVKGVDAKGKPIWLLAPEAKAVVEDVEARIKILMEKLGSIAGTQNIDRILRLPWTTNLPNEVKRTKGRTACQSSLLSADASVCKLEDFPALAQDAGHAGAVDANTGIADRDFNSSRPESAPIDWAAAEQHKDWLKSVANLPADFSPKGRAIVAHTGTLKDLNFDLQHANALLKPYQSWSEVAFALAAIFKSDGRFSNEQIAAALLAGLECNQHIKHQANKRRAIERLILRSHEPPAGKVSQAGAPNWREQRKDGSPTASMHNARLAITALGVECSNDLFHNKLLFGFKDGHFRHAVEQMVGEVTDNGIIALRQLMSDTFGFDLTEKHTRDAVISLALEHCFDPVVEMLAQAEANSDGVKRLDRMAAEYFNCEDTKLNAAFMRKTMIAATARARNPGCKFDNIIVLESAEGFNKSTAIRVLAGDENFSDESIIGKESREVQEQLAGVWLHENAELAGMQRKEVEKIKNYASKQVDRARPAYGHFNKWQPRRSVEFGTTNSAEYLQSQTGNRRFWPLRVLKSIGIEKLRRDRLQLWDEAARYQSQGESLVLDEALWGEAGIEQEARRITDPWEDALRIVPEWVTVIVREVSGAGFQEYKERDVRIVHREDDEDRVAAADLLEHVLKILPGNQRTEHSMRLSAVMRKLGWDRPSNGNLTVGGKRVKGYFRRS